MTLPPAIMIASLLLVSGCRDTADTDTAPDAGAAGAVDGGASQADAAVQQPDAMAAGTSCTTKNPIVQLGYTCQFAWSGCTSGSQYGIDCRITNIAGNVFSLCDCSVNGSNTMQFGSDGICGLAGWPEVEAEVNQECGWDLL